MERLAVCDSVNVGTVDQGHLLLSCAHEQEARGEKELWTVLARDNDKIWGDLQIQARIGRVNA